MSPEAGPYVGRLAPSPTGDVHLGIARTSLAAWLDARSQGGKLLMRIEDIDKGRCVPGAAERIQEDLAWLGLDWDGPTLHQSDRDDHYQAALDRLFAQGRTFACTCSRKEIAQASSAPHGASGLRYPGTCRAGAPSKPGRTPSVRLRTEPGDFIEHTDRLLGAADQDVHAAVGDFVLKRADGLWAYQLAVTVDDLAQGVTTIVRGADLLDSTPRQLLLRRLLVQSPPPISTLHIPLVLSEDNKRLAKRHGAIALRTLRAQGTGPQVIVGLLAQSLGLVPHATPISATALIERWAIDRIPKAPVSLTPPSAPERKPERTP